MTEMFWLFDIVVERPVAIGVVVLVCESDVCQCFSIVDVGSVEVLVVV